MFERVRQPRAHALASKQRQHLEQTRAECPACHRDAHGVNQGACLDATFVRNRSQGALERRDIERLDRFEGVLDRLEMRRHSLGT